jgi:hypothetical protein
MEAVVGVVRKKLSRELPKLVKKPVAFRHTINEVRELNLLAW